MRTLSLPAALALACAAPAATRAPAQRASDAVPQQAQPEPPATSLPGPAAGAHPKAADATDAAGEPSMAHLESGDDANEDAAPEGLVSRASGRPDHPRTLDEIVKSGYLRVLTRNNDTSFFIYRGHRMGFDYEVGKKLAQHLGIRVDMIITSGWSEMVPALLRGEGDAIAAELTVTPARARQVLFTEPWARTNEVIVWRRGTAPVGSADELSGKQVHVRRGSTYFDTLTALSARLTAAGKAPIDVQIVPEDWETDTVLGELSRGKLTYTVADELLASVHTAYLANLVVGPALAIGREVAWAVRPGDTRLRQAIDDTFAELRRKPDFNLLYRKYFEAERTLRKEHKDRFYASETGTLSPFDPLVRKHAEAHGFDWRLVAAQIYQESHFDPRRKSWVGALGLFQIMPATARALGVLDPVDPEQSIRGGLKYMQQLTNHYADVPDPIERYRFALAAYNSGFGHVDDARKLARDNGADPRRWREVAKWLLRLSDRRVAARARYGYCRGFEPVDYVRHIDERYAGYAQLVPLAGRPR